MSEGEVKAQIYYLSGQILTGKATKEGVKEVVDLAKKHGLLSLLKQEFEYISSCLISTKKPELLEREDKNHANETQ